MNRYLAKTIVIVTALFACNGVFAETYSVVITGTHSGNLLFTAGPPGSSSLITAVTGTLDGQTVTGLNNLCGADNRININGQLGFVSGGGISITYGSGSNYTNLYSNMSGGPIDRYQINCGAIDVVTTSVSLLPPAPIPTLSEWAMIFMASLMGMFAFVRLRRT